MKRHSGMLVNTSQYGRRYITLTTKANSSSVSNNSSVRNTKARTNDFIVGDLVWAKIGKYPVWPGIIISDPESNKIFKKENSFTMLHVYFCNDSYKRNWIKTNQIFKFTSKNKLLTESPKTSTIISRSTLKTKWNRAVDEAECLVAMSRDNRIKAFFANNYLPHITIPLLNASQIGNSKRETPKNKIKSSKNNTPINSLQVVSPEIKKQKQKIKISSVTEANTMQIDNSKSNKPQDPSTRSNEKRKLLEVKSQPNNNKTTIPNGLMEIDNRKRQKLIPRNFPKDHPRTLIPALCKQFYSNGWVTGTGGGISIKYNDQIFIAPSGVQKEQLEPEDLFVQDMNGVDIEVPLAEKNFSKSQCTPIFMCSYNERNAGAVIHIHSPTLHKLCMLNPGNELRIKDMENIKGIYNEEKDKYYDNDEEVIIPIIANTKYERNLVDTFKMALNNYPMTSAVIVRNHGLYVWGKDWKSAKTQCECYEYVFELMVFKKIHNL